MPIKAYHNVSKIKYYHVLLRRVYDILIEKLLDTDRDILLQITVKAVNDTTSLNGLIPILLV
jgi:hypothetical protein